jgi:hypothetical protein
VAKDSGTLIDLQQPGGRSLWCWNYIVAYTYDGFSVRTASEDCNAHMLDVVRHEAARQYGDHWPVHVVPPLRQPGEIDYPRVRVTAFFTSLPIRDEMHLSSLVVVWFQREQTPVPDEAGRSAIAQLDWERLALDYET